MEQDTLPVGEVLNDSQRIEQLEKSQKLDRLLLIALGGTLLVILASWMTYAGILSSREQPASRQSVDHLQQQIAGLEQQVSGLQQQLASPPPTPAAAPAPQGTDDPAVAQQVARTLIGQERNFQQALAALKLGMRDLAGMIAGSRSWLTQYHEALDTPLGESRARMQELADWGQRLSTAPHPNEPAAAE
jgi:hypothetical protein